MMPADPDVMEKQAEKFSGDFQRRVLALTRQGIGFVRRVQEVLIFIFYITVHPSTIPIWNERDCR